MLGRLGKGLLHPCFFLSPCATLARQPLVESRLICLSSVCSSSVAEPPQDQNLRPQDQNQPHIHDGQQPTEDVSDQEQRPELFGTKMERVERARFEKVLGVKLGMFPVSLNAMFKEHNSSLPKIQGQMIKGRVIDVQRRVVFIETGYRSHVKFFKSELSTNQVVSCDDNSPRMSKTDFRVGDVMHFKVEEIESPTSAGHMMLGSGSVSSEKRKDVVWDELEKCCEEGQDVMGRVLNSVNGGYAVGIAGWVAFCPYSAISLQTASRIGVLQPFFINKMTRAKGNIVVRDARHAAEAPRNTYKGYQGQRGAGFFAPRTPDQSQ